jgi:hypothetical protein
MFTFTITPESFRFLDQQLKARLMSDRALYSGTKDKTSYTAQQAKLRVTAWRTLTDEIQSTIQPEVLLDAIANPEESS